MYKKTFFLTTIYSVLAIGIIRAQSMDTTYFDDQSRIVNDKDSMSYSRVVRLNKNGKPVGKVFKYFKNGNIRWEGYLLSISPEKKDGLCTEYEKDGSINNSDYYINGKTIGEIINQRKIFLPDSGFTIKQTIEYLNKNLNISLIDTNISFVLINIAKDINIGCCKRNAEDFGYLSLKAAQITGDSLIIASNLTSLGDLYKKFGDYEKAEHFFLDALRIRENHLDSLNPAIMRVINRLGDIYLDKAEFTKAEKYLLKDIEITKRIYGINSVEYTTSLNNIANLYYYQGEFDQSELFYKKCVTIRRNILGTKSKLYAIAINNLSSLYHSMGNYLEAESLLLEAQKIRKEILGEMHTDYAFTLNNLGMLYVEMGNFIQAEKHLNQALHIRKNNLGIEHPDYIVTVHNLADLYYSTAIYEKAEPLYKKSISLFEKTLGKDHPYTGYSKHNYAVLCNAMGNYKKSDSIFSKLLEEKPGLYKNKNVHFASLCQNFAELKFNQGNIPEAEKYFTEAVNIRETQLGKSHDHLAASLNYLAELHITKGEYEKASQEIEECAKINLINLKNKLSFLSEPEKAALFIKHETQIGKLFENIYHCRQYKPELVNLGYEITTCIKNSLFRSTEGIKNILANTADSSINSTFNHWISLKRELVQIYKKPILYRIKDPTLIEKKIQQIEKKLMIQSDELKQFFQNFETPYNKIENLLNKNETIVETFKYKISIKGRPDSLIYCAFVIRSGFEYPNMIKLFGEKSSKSQNLIADKFRPDDTSIADQKRGIEPVLYKKDEEANYYQMIWKALIPYASNSKKLLFSPVGLLNLIPVSTIRMHSGKYLVNKTNLILTHDPYKYLVSEDRKLNNINQVLVIGGVEYGSKKCRNNYWQFLPGSKKEVLSINKNLKENKIKTLYFDSIYAKESVFKKSASGNSIIHISSHGFFFDNPTLKNHLSYYQKIFRKEQEISYTGIDYFSLNPNPLIRSGIAFSQANCIFHNNNNEEDNILTANEVTLLNLKKTKLVVLSACQTGLGDIRGYEGAYGLQRAFRIAGAQNIIVSLWNIPDIETQEFMSLFYKYLLRSYNIHDSFIKAQKKMQKKYHDPFYWGGFVLIE